MTPRPPLAVFHPGTQHSWQTALALQDLGRLAFYATSIHYDPAKWSARIARLPGPLARRLESELGRFRIPALDPALIRARGWHEWAERFASRAGLHRLSKQLDLAGNRAFARSTAIAARQDGVAAVWGYDNSSLEAFRALEGSQVRRILDVTVAPLVAYNRLLEGIAAEWPDFVLPSLRGFPDEVLRRTAEELRLADVIVAGSPFVRDTILAEMPGEGGLAEKIRILPYSWSEALFARPAAPTLRPAGEPLRLLFVGSIGLRKGAHLLLEAIARIPAADVALTMVGSVDMPASTFARYADRVDHIPHLPRSAIPGVMAQHDALILPSYFEGSAITLLEALASGLALIQSPYAGLGVTGQTGIMLETLSVDAVESAIRHAGADRERLLAWRQAALLRAQEFTFARYRDNIAALLDDFAI